MKLLTCPSSSSSSFGPNMSISKSVTAGCLAGIVRRILCSGSLPTHPSDHITDETGSVKSDKYQNGVMSSKIKDEEEALITPGIVARLMGLDSLPEISSRNEPDPKAISRSKSMNSVDQLRDEAKAKQRRLKSTLSFREMPAFLEVEEDEDFLILSFENVGERKKFRPKERKFEMGSGEPKQRKYINRGSKTEKQKKKKKKKKREEVINLIDITNSAVHSSRIRSSAFNKEVESDCSSEDLSPVSVLDCDQIHSDSEVTSSDIFVEEEDSRKKLSSEMENLEHPSARNEENLMTDGEKAKENGGKSSGLRKKVCQSESNGKGWDDICRLIDAELVGSNWICKGAVKQSNDDYHEELEGIYGDLEGQIFDKLLCDLVNQLVVVESELPMKQKSELVRK